jgi:hypothetical protein
MIVNYFNTKTSNWVKTAFCGVLFWERTKKLLFLMGVKFVG